MNYLFKLQLNDLELPGACYGPKDMSEETFINYIKECHKASFDKSKDKLVVKMVGPKLSLLSPQSGTILPIQIRNMIATYGKDKVIKAFRETINGD